MTENDVRDVFGYNLKRIRKMRGISQLQLATIADMNFTFISDIENGKKWVSPESIAKFTKALDIEAYQFFLPKDYQPKQSADLISFAKELSESFQLIKSRYSIP